LGLCTSSSGLPRDNLRRAVCHAHAMPIQICHASQKAQRTNMNLMNEQHFYEQLMNNVAMTSWANKEIFKRQLWFWYQLLIW